MATNPEPLSPLSTTDAQIHYVELLSFFKNLVWITGTALGIIAVVGAYVFHSSLQDALRDVKQKVSDEATTVATEESRKRVNKAFEESNIKEVIATVASEKIKNITDKMIEQQLSSKNATLRSKVSGCR